MPRSRLRRKDVVEAAATIADAKGVDAVTLSGLADHLRIRTPSLYNHVSSLSDLRRHLTILALHELYDAIQADVGDQEGARAVQSLCRAYRAWAGYRPGLYACVVPTTEVDDNDIRQAGDQLLSLTMRILAPYGFDEGETVHAARQIRSTLHGFIILDHNGGFGLQVDRADSFEWIVSSVLSGLAAIAHPPASIKPGGLCESPLAALSLARLPRQTSHPAA